MQSPMKGWRNKSRTALEVARTLGNELIMRLLLEYGAKESEVEEISRDEELEYTHS